MRLDRSPKPWIMGAGAVVAAVAAVKLLLHLYAGRRYGYFGDELYYLACADHLAWGYVDQPPLVALARVEHPYSMPHNHFDVFDCRGLRLPLKELWPQVKSWN
jgi:hypothetical protein